MTALPFTNRYIITLIYSSGGLFSALNFKRRVLLLTIYSKCALDFAQNPCYGLMNYPNRDVSELCLILVYTELNPLSFTYPLMQHQSIAG